MNVRSSLYTRATKSHEHEYGEEEYIEEDDEYSKTCLTCGHSYRYDKLWAPNFLQRTERIMECLLICASPEICARSLLSALP